MKSDEVFFGKKKSEEIEKKIEKKFVLKLKFSF